MTNQFLQGRSSRGVHEEAGLHQVDRLFQCRFGNDPEGEGEWREVENKTNKKWRGRTLWGVSLVSTVCRLGIRNKYI